MRARQRHFNPGSAGAVLALDSRFITGLSDGDPVSTWIDRSGRGNNITQTSTARPTYKIAQQSGQPVIRFDGLDDSMINTSTSLVTAGSSWGLIASGRMNAAIADLRGNIFATRTTTRYWGCMYLRFQSTNYIHGNGVDLSANVTLSNITFRTLPWVSSWIMNGSGNQPNHFTNGQSRSINSAGTSQITETGTTGFVVGSNVSNQWHHGDIWNIIVVPGGISSSLRRRIEHSTAISFKIACS